MVHSPLLHFVRGHSQTGTLMHFLHRRAPIWFSSCFLLCLFFFFYYFQISGYHAAVKNRALEGKKIRFGSSSKPVCVGFSCSPHASELRDKHGHYVLLSEGARVQIHISIFSVLIPVCGDVHLCWTRVINQLSAAFSEAAVHFSRSSCSATLPSTTPGEQQNIQSEKHLQHKWWRMRQERDERGVITGRDRQGGGRWETTKRKPAFQSRVENSGAWAAQMRTLFLFTLKLQQWGSWGGDDASLKTTSVVTITFSPSAGHSFAL